jgi:cytochrome c oxidase subunit 3
MPELSLSLDAPGVGGTVEMQYASAEHQASTAIAGVWLFLTTEVLFFGALFLTFLVYRVLHPAGFAEATEHTELAIGAANTVILLCSSLTMGMALEYARAGNNRRVQRLTLLTAALGIAFLVLKGLEWHDDLSEHMFPGADFAIQGAHQGPARLFWCFYFVSTGLHGAHMVAGIGLVLWVALQARRGAFTPSWYTPVEAVGIYWSFVDLIWVVLFALIYVAGRV